MIKNAQLFSTFGYFDHSQILIIFPKISAAQHVWPWANIPYNTEMI